MPPNHIGGVGNGYQEGVKRVQGVVGSQRKGGDATAPTVVGIKHPSGETKCVGFGMLDF